MNSADDRSSQASKPIADDSVTRPVVPSFEFESLAQGAKTIHIELDGEIYLLKRTRNNRLILQK